MGGEEEAETSRVKKKKTTEQKKDTKNELVWGVENSEMKSEKDPEEEMIQTFPLAEIQGAEER